MPELAALDQTLLVLLQPALAWPPLGHLMLLLTYSGTLEAGLCAVGLAWLARARWAPAVSLIGITNLGLVTLLKRCAERPRPYLEGIGALPFNLSTLQDPSLPSGHAALSVMLAIVIGRFAPRWRRPLACWATGVCLSRVALGVHYPFDVLAGAAIGWAVTSALLGLPPLRPPRIQP